MKKKLLQHLLQLGAVLFLVLLAGCDSASSQAVPTPTQAPVPTATATADPVVSGADWTTYHQNNARTGSVASIPDPKQLAQAWNIKLDGAVYAEPLVVGTHVIVATEGDTLYALDRQTGQEQWHTNVGSPVAQSTLPCGDIDPLGITGTPVYDPATKLVFAIAEIKGPAHILVGVDVDTGQVKIRRSADIPGMDPKAYQQRAALALSHNMVYFAYGGLAGDCSDYRGTIIAARTDGSGSLLSYRIPTPREGGIWAPSGPAVDKNGNIYVAVGNGEVKSGAWDKSDSILRFSPELRLEDGFAPIQWQHENATDADLGSTGPILLPGGLIFADGKSGRGYLLHANALGGIGGQALVASTCRSFGGAAALGSQLFVPCTDGLRVFQVGPGVSLKQLWHASSRASGSPVVGGHTVYSLNPDGTLYALDVANGNERTHLSVGAVSRFATPTLSGSQIFVGTYTGIVAVTIS